MRPRLAILASSRSSAFVVASIVSVVAAPSCGGVADRTRDPAVASQAPLPHHDSGAERTATHAATPPPPSSTTTTEPPPTTTDAWATAPALETIEGRVSYYHDSLAGNRTANGETYDPTALTCASRDLPFGTLIRVVRPDTGAFVVVRVNDRGPWGRRHPRILDLSRAAAEALDMVRAGVIEVRAEVVRRGE